MIAVLNTTDSLTAVLSGAAATTNPTYFADWREATGTGKNQATGTLNGATAVTLVAAPTIAQRIVDKLRVYNADSAAVVVTVAKLVSGTSYTMAVVTLQSSDTLTVDAQGVRVIDSSGQARIIRTGYTTQVGTRAKVGGTSGWTVGATNDVGTIATMAAGQTAGTLVIPLDGLHIGDTITGFKINAQVESAGNTVTIDGSLRALTNVAADPTDASIGSITQVSVTADTAVAASKTGLSEVVAAGKTYYLLVTATTAASTDIQLLAPELTVTTA